MDLHEEWKKWQESAQLDQKELNLPKLSELKGNAQLPIEKLRKQFRIKMVFVFIFIIGFLTILILNKEPFIQAALVIILIFYFIAAFLTIKDYQLFRKEIPMDESMIDTLEKISTTIRKTIQFEEKFALFIYPISFTGGFMLGFSMVTPLEEFFADKYAIPILVGAISIVTPLSYFISKKLNQKRLGKYLDKLDNMIDDFRELS